MVEVAIIKVTGIVEKVFAVLKIRLFHRSHLRAHISFLRSLRSPRTPAVVEKAETGCSRRRNIDLRPWLWCRATLRLRLDA